MKNLIHKFTLLLLCLSFGINLYSQQAFYVYKNDGGINAFFTDEVDSIIYSHLDADSIFHRDYVVQEIYTNDSIYRIPLEVIDSVGYVTPETKYQSNVIVLESTIRDYIVGSDSLSIFFRTDTPRSILPRMGDKLVTTEVSDVFFSGFAGQVVEIKEEDGIILIKCTSVGLEEVFETFYYVSRLSDDNTAKSQRTMRRAEKTWVGGPYSPGTTNIPLTNLVMPVVKPDINGDLAFQVESNLNVGVTPTFYGKAMFIVSPQYGVVVSLDLTEEDRVTEDFSLSGMIQWEHDFPAVHRPIFNLGIPFLWFYSEAGAFLRAEGTASIEHHWAQNFRYTFHYEVGSKNLFLPRASINGIQLTNEHSGQGLVKGSFGGGIYIELGVEFLDKRLASTAFRGEAGIKLDGDVMLYKREAETSLHSTDVYKTLQGNKLSFCGFYNVGLQANLLNMNWSHNFNNPQKSEHVFAEVGIVPNFADTKLERDEGDKSILYASSKASGNCMPVDLGFTLFEKDVLEDGKTSYSRYGYMGSSAEIYASYYDVSKENKYEVYPTVKIFGIEMLATPSASEDDFCPDENHPHMIDLGCGVWSCCNVGASTPEDFGGYYAWGEVNEKSTYNEITYEYATGKDTNGDGWYDDDAYFQLFGSSMYGISGTSYDVAYRRWGADWRMPTNSDVSNLINGCSWTLYTKNGVAGLKATGSSGKSIFIPAAGCKLDNTSYGIGINGYYWSASWPVNESGVVVSGGGPTMYFNTEQIGMDIYGRAYGFSVRPIAQ